MPASRTRMSRAYLVATAFLSGFAVMVLEMAAVRAVAPYFGASTYTWTNVIGVILGALAVGYFLGGRAADRWPRPSLLFAVLLSGGLLCLLVPLLVRPLADWLLDPELSLEGAVGMVNRASLLATLVLFAPPALLLGGVSPMAIKLLADADRVGGASGQVFAASTVGSLLGTFLTTFQLIPELGTRSTIMLAGGVLVGTAVVGMLLSGLSLKSAGGAAAAVLLALGFFLGGASAGPLRGGEGQVQGSEVESEYQYLRVREFTDPAGKALLLQVNETKDGYQSVKMVKPPSALTGGRYYDYYAALPLLLGGPARERLDVLAIGVGAGTIPMQLHHFFGKGLHVTGVEIDDAALRLGHEYFGLPRAEDAKWLDLRSGVDGRVFLNSLPPEPTFDLVILDAFTQEYYIPFHLATRETMERARDVLEPGGILAMNVSAYEARSPLLGAIEATIADVWKSDPEGRAYRVQVVGYSSQMLLACRGRSIPFGRHRRAKAGTATEWAKLLEVAGTIEREARRIRPREDAVVLTDDLAPVERLTDRSVRRESRAILDE